MLNTAHVLEIRFPALIGGPRLLTFAVTTVVSLSTCLSRPVIKKGVSKVDALHLWM